MIDENVIAQILSEHPELSREALLQRLEEERHRTGGFISDGTLLRMLAAHLEVNIQNDDSSIRTFPIRNLVPNLSDVTVVGRVVAIFPPRNFDGKRKGRFASLLVADKDDMLRVVFWNDETRLVENGLMKAGQIIRLLHGYTKEDRDGSVELHVGAESRVEIDPVDVQAKDYPGIRRFVTKIKELSTSSGNRKVNLIGFAKRFYPPSTFTRQDSSSGRVMRLVFADGTGEISVIVWNEKAEELEKMLQKSARLQIVNARLKAAIGETPEVHVDNNTYVETIAQDDQPVSIADVKEGLCNIIVEGVVATKPALKEVKTSNGETVKLASFELKDETGRIWVSAWRMHAEKVGSLNRGDAVTLNNVYVRKGFSDQLEISTKVGTSVAVLSKSPDK